MAKAKLYTSYVFMRKRYIVERKTEQEIADELGVNQSIINRWLVRHNLKRPR